MIDPLDHLETAFADCCTTERAPARLGRCVFTTFMDSSAELAKGRGK